MAKEKLEEELVEQEHIFHYNTTVHSGISELKAQYSGLRISTVVRAAIKDHLESPFKVVMSQKGLVGKIQCEEDEPVYITNIKKAAVSHLLTLSMSEMTKEESERQDSSVYDYSIKTYIHHITPAMFNVDIETIAYLPSHSPFHKVFNERQGHLRISVDRVNKNSLISKFKIQITGDTTSAPYNFEFLAPNLH